MPEAFKTIVWLLPPFTVYVTVAFGVPVKVTVPLEPEHNVKFEDILTVGSGSTVITTV